MFDPNRAIRLARRLIVFGISVPAAILLLYLFFALRPEPRMAMSADEGMGQAILFFGLVSVGTLIMTLSTGIGTVLIWNALLRRTERPAPMNVALCVIGAVFAVPGLILIVVVARQLVIHG